MKFYHAYKWLLPSLVFTAILIVVRVVWVREISFAFLIWNLFLAVLPLYFSFKTGNTRNRFVATAWAAAWLLFFPNAIYITTDIFHLEEYPPVPRWLDLVILISAAINGLIFGLLSLHNIEKRLAAFVPAKYLGAIVFTLLLLCGYGIYLGRYLRWNSWDIVTAPFALGHDIAHHVFHPFRYANVWTLTFVFGLWMFIMYRFLKQVGQRTSP